MLSVTRVLLARTVPRCAAVRLINTTTDVVLQGPEEKMEVTVPTVPDTKDVGIRILNWGFNYLNYK